MGVYARDGRRVDRHHCNIGETLRQSAPALKPGTIKNGSMIWGGVHLRTAYSLIRRSPPTTAIAASASSQATPLRRLKSTVIGRGASVGAGAVIITGVTVGEFYLLDRFNRTKSSPYLVGPTGEVRLVCQCGQLGEMNGGQRGRCDLSREGSRRRFSQPSVGRPRATAGAAKPFGRQSAVCCLCAARVSARLSRANQTLPTYGVFGGRPGGEYP